MSNSRPTSYDETRSVSSRDSFMDFRSPSPPDTSFSIDYRRPRSDTANSGDPLFSSSLQPAPRHKSKSSIRIDTDTASSALLEPIRQLTSSPVNSSQSSKQYGLKPPVPTTPKPNFRRSISAEPSHISRSASSQTAVPYGTRDHQSSATSISEHLPPPTTNFLKPQERADLVRKSRKLAQVFGETPSPLSVSPRQYESTHVLSGRGPPNRTRHDVRSLAGDSAGLGVEQPSRRVSAQFTPSPSGRSSTQLSTNDVVMAPSLSGSRSGSGKHSGRGGEVREREERGRRDGMGGRGSRRESEDLESASFIDLSDEESSDHTDAREQSHAANQTVHGRSPSLSSLNSPPFFHPVDSAEEDRKRNREKLAKLHRYLGSRVPADLVLGPTDIESSLPQPMAPQFGNERRRGLRRRSSSAAELKSSWYEYDDVDRMKEDLDEHEKAINVRRAVKMEKLFGVQPPQTLYHTRQSPVPSSPITLEPRRFSSLERDRHSPTPIGLPSSPTGRNINQSAYINKGRGKSHRHSIRSTLSESTQNLLLDHDGSDGSPNSPILFAPPNRLSSIYMHYRHSLNSLNDIIDRDDKESLAELHQYITNELADVEQHTPTLSRPPHDVDAKVIRAERRRSFPTTSSTLSLTSQFNLGSPDAEMVSFQARRRRAAKLTNFFGVDYRELIGEILESIETGVQEEGHRGSLHPDEVQDLLRKLRNLKTKRSVAM